MPVLGSVVVGAATASLLLLAGCVTPPLNADPNAAVDPTAKGLLVVGVEPIAKPEDLGKVQVGFNVRAGDGGVGMPDEFAVDKSQKVYVLALQAGEYSVGDWTQFASVMNRVSAPVKYRFRIVAGQATYIGTFETLLERRENAFGMRVVPWSSATVRDRRDRDIAQFRAQFPKFRDWPLRYDVVDGFAWTDSRTSLPATVQQTPMSKGR